MARRGWGGSVATAIGVAAGAGAAQLGFGYGLGIINWTPTGATRVEAAWAASLAWATWISATSVVAGAVCAQRLAGSGVDDEEPGGTLRKLTLSVAGAVGALITVLLVAVPARGARVPDTFSPQTVAAGYAAVGLLVGVLVATWALHSRAAAANLIATTGWLWLLAVVSVVDGVLSGRGLVSAQLGIWQISADSDRFWIRDYFYWPGALLSTGSALLIGALAARRAARAPERRIGAAASGAAGPLLVAVACLLAVPRLAAISAEQVSAHLIAPYAVIAGVGGSLLVAALAQRADRRAPAQAGVTLPRQRSGEHDDLTTGPGGPSAQRVGLDGPAGDDGPDTADQAGEPAARRGGILGRRRTATGTSGPAPVALAAEPVPPVDAPTATTTRTRPAPRRGRANPPAPEATTTPGASSPPTDPTTSDRAATDPATVGTGAGSASAPGVRPSETPSADVPDPTAPAEATGRPESGTAAPTTGPKNRPGRRNR